jgi:hypothetical protein
MRLSARFVLILCAAAAQGCINSTVAFHVNADASGRVVVTSRVYDTGVEAFDSIFSDPQPKAPPQLTELLPEPAPGAVEHALGTPVRLVSSTLERAPDGDGGIRRTVVEFDDITRVRLTFPPEFALPSGMQAFFGLAIGAQTPVITFARRPHENGDEMLILKMLFLEYQPPQRAAQPAAQPPAAQAPPDTEIYLVPMKVAGGAITLGAPANITNNPGYDNQPLFTADGRSILFTSVRPSTTLGPNGAPQSDIYRYDIPAAQTTQITNTPESEYSPTITPSGALSVVRVEIDADKTQRLWQFSADGRDPRVLLPNLKPVGYHAWADDHTVALFILGAAGAPATLQLADTRSGTAVVLATDVGRSMQPIPGPGPAHAISFVQREHTNGTTSLVIKEIDAATHRIGVLTAAVEGSTEADTAWMPDGTLLMSAHGVLYSWRRGQSAWTEVASLERMGLTGVTRLAVSPRGNWLAVVAAPQTSR